MKKTATLIAVCSAAGVLCVTSALAQTKAPSTSEFVMKVAMSDMTEIQMSELALGKQPDADTKPFAERMVKDHEQTSKELKALVDSGKVKAPLPNTLDAEHQRELDNLKGKTGKDFDRAYDQAQLKAHEQAVMLFEAYAGSGDNPDLKAWAAKTLPHLQEHLAMAKKLT